MRVKFNKYERAAGALVLSSIVGGLFVLFTISISKGWFSTTVDYFTFLETAEGVREGTAVEMAGLRIGKVNSIRLNDENQVRVALSVYDQFKRRIRRDSRIQIIRPYVIGEKVLYVSPGTNEAGSLNPGSLIPAEEVFGLTDILNGRKLIPYMETMSKAFSGLKELVDLMLKNKGSVHFVQMLEGMYPLLRQATDMSSELTKLSRQMNRGQKMGKLVENMYSVSEELKNLGPQLSGNKPGLGKDLGRVVSNLAVLTEEMRKITPAIAAIAPQLPKSSLRMVEAIDEAVIVLKAMQKTFLLRGSAEEVREEERAPASGDKE